MAMKVLQALEKSILPCKCIALYPTPLEDVLYSSVEKKEYPKLLVKRVLNDRLNCAEIEVVFVGNYHLEKPAYFKKPKSEWASFGSFVLNPQQAKQLGEFLVKLASHVEGA